MNNSTPSCLQLGEEETCSHDVYSHCFSLIYKLLCSFLVFCSSEESLMRVNMEALSKEILEHYTFQEQNIF